MAIDVTIPGDLPVMASDLVSWVRHDKAKSGEVIDTLDEFHARAVAAMERAGMESVTGWATIDGRPGEAFHLTVHADGTVTVLGVAQIS